VRDFGEAEKVGMAVRVPLDAALLTELWNGPGKPISVVALGVRDTQTPAQGAATLAGVLAAHARTAGLDLVPVGTPTNNTSEARSGFDPDGDAAAALATLVAGTTAPEAGQNGGRLARALGLPASVFGDAAFARADADGDAAAMNAALWPATWGYFLEQMMNPLVGDDAIAGGRRLFVEHVRARGPLPTLRVGRQPYGILPVLPLARWKAIAGTGTAYDDGALASLVTALGGVRGHFANLVADVPRIPESGDAGAALEAVLAVRPSGLPGFVRAIDERNTARARNPSWDPFDFDWYFEAIRNLLVQQLLSPLGLSGIPHAADFILDDVAKGIEVALVSGDPDADPALPPAPAYLTAIAQATPDELRADAPIGDAPRTLLYLLARHAALLAYGRASDALQGVTRAQRIDREDQPSTSTVWTRLAQKHAASNTSYAELLHHGQPPAHVAVGELTQLRAALPRLAGLPVAELERLVREGLDLTSYRLDAWITAIATRRLAALRGLPGKDSGVYVGGFGWVEGLRVPRFGFPPFYLAPRQDGAAPETLSSNQGFMLAPSLGHARTAALLRAGYLAHRAEGEGTSLAVNLSSDRVRNARWLLESVEQGQSFASLLGFRVERVLLAQQPPALAALDALRASYPLRVTADGSSDGARLCDGLAVWEAMLDQGRAAQSAPLQAVYDDLHELVDATADLLVAEAVHQTVQGQPARARAALEAMETFDRSLGQLDVVRTPAEADRQSVRVAFTLPDKTTGWPGDGKRVRALADERLNAWVAELLGAPAALTLTASLPLADGTKLSKEVTLADLDVCPLDVVVLAGDGTGEPPLAALARTYVRLADETLPAEATIDVQLGSALVDALYAARAVRRLLSVARPLAPADLSTSVDPGAPPPASPELDARGAKIRAQLNTDYYALANKNLKEIVRVAAFFGVEILSGADPAGTLAKLAIAKRNAYDAATGVDARARLELVLGKELPFAEALAWPSPPALDDAAWKPEASGAWLHDLARVRPALEALDEATLLAPPQPNGTPVGAYQLDAATQLMLVGATPAANVAGFYLDTFTETRPTGAATAGVGFHYDAPNARPPQTLLVVVPPDADQPWSPVTVLEGVLEAFDLARLRLVAPPAAAGQFLPATFVAANADNDTISTDLAEIAVKLTY
jgi:hypothetical protein